jgi:hypothetical protein
MPHNRECFEKVAPDYALVESSEKLKQATVLPACMLDFRYEVGVSGGTPEQVPASRLRVHVLARNLVSLILAFYRRFRGVRPPMTAES